jgi:hypothetical protein
MPNRTENRILSHDPEKRRRLAEVVEHPFFAAEGDSVVEVASALSYGELATVPVGGEVPLERGRSRDRSSPRSMPATAEWWILEAIAWHSPFSRAASDGSQSETGSKSQAHVSIAREARFSYDDSAMSTKLPRKSLIVFSPQKGDLPQLLALSRPRPDVNLASLLFPLSSSPIGAQV